METRVLWETDTTLWKGLHIISPSLNLSTDVKAWKAPELYKETPWFILGLVLKGLVSGETFSRNEMPDGHLLFFSPSTYLAQYWQTSSLSLSINLADTHLAPALPRGPAHPNLLPWTAPPNQHLAHLIQRLALSSTNIPLLYQANITGYRVFFNYFKSHTACRWLSFYSDI